MSTRTCGLVWRQAEPSEVGQCQLLTVKLNGRFIWTHGYKDDTFSHVFSSSNLNKVLPLILKEGAFWVGPEEMSGWNDDA